jgi:hypothetical protein
MLCRCRTTLNAGAMPGLFPLPQLQAPSRVAGSFFGTQADIPHCILCDLNCREGGVATSPLSREETVHFWMPVTKSCRSAICPVAAE